MIVVQHLYNVVNDRIKVIADFWYFKIYDHALVICNDRENNNHWNEYNSFALIR